MGLDFLTDSQLKAIMPLVNPEKRRVYLPWLNISMARFNINTELRVAMYLAQLAHESTDLTRWVENLNYSAKRMTQVWPRRFPNITAATPYAHNPTALANKSYNGRMGNRVGSNDGWDFRGRAPLQATGRDMYAAITRAIGEEFGADFVQQPDLLLQVKFGFLASAWIFAVEKKCLPLADAKNLRGCTVRINGGTTGLSDRLANYRVALSVLPDSFRLKSYQDFMREFDNEVVAVDAQRSDLSTSRLDVTNQEVFDVATIPDDESSAPAVEGGADTGLADDASGGPNTDKLHVKVDGENVSIEKENSAPPLPQKVAVIKPEDPPPPDDFITKIRNKIAILTGGNIGLQAVRDYADQVQFLGLSATFWFYLTVIAAAGAIIYLIFAWWKHKQDVEKRIAQQIKETTITQELVSANKTDNNFVQLISAAEADQYKERGYKVITR